MRVHAHKAKHRQAVKGYRVRDWQVMTDGKCWEAGEALGIMISINISSIHHDLLKVSDELMC